MNPAVAQPYRLEQPIDIYGSTVYPGEHFVIFNEADDVVHLENVFEYLEEKHQDLSVQLIDCENELVEYIKEIYDVGVYEQ